MTALKKPLPIGESISRRVPRQRIVPGDNGKRYSRKCKSYEGICVSFECKKKELKLGIAERDLIIVDLPFLRSLPEGPL